MTTQNPGPSSSVTSNDQLATQANVAAAIAAATPTRGSIAATSVFKNRIALIGDSITQFSIFYGNLPTTVGSFVVSGGVATLTFGSNAAPFVGNYNSLNNTADPFLTHPDNGRFVPAITGSTGTTAVATWTFASNAPNGDYSNYLGGTWNIANTAGITDTGLISWLNAALRGQFLVSANYACVGETSTFTLNKVKSRVFAAGAVPFDIALLAVDGINDYNQLSPIGTAIAAANAAIANYIQCIQILQAGGVQVWIQLGPPNQGTSGSGAQTNNICANIVRNGMLNYCLKSNQVVIFDTFKEMVAGQATASPFFATSNGLAMTAPADGIHPNANGYSTMVRDLRAGSAAELEWLPRIALPNEFQSVTVLDDSVTYPQVGAVYSNLQKASGLAGTGGTLNGTPTPTGSAATNTTLTGVGSATSVVGTGGFTPTQLGSSNSANYAFAQRVQCTTSAANQGFTFSMQGIGLVTGQWYRMGWRVYVRANTSGVGSLYGSYNVGPRVLGFGGNGAFDLGYQLNAGEVYWLTSGPMFWSVAPSIGILSLAYASAGAGSVDLEISAPFIRQIDNPYV